MQTFKTPVTRKVTIEKRTVKEANQSRKPQGNHNIQSDLVKSSANPTRTRSLDSLEPPVQSPSKLPNKANIQTKAKEMRINVPSSTSRKYETKVANSFEPLANDYELSDMETEHSSKQKRKLERSNSSSPTNKK